MGRAASSFSKPSTSNSGPRQVANNNTNDNLYDHANLDDNKTLAIEYKPEVISMRSLLKARKA